MLLHLRTCLYLTSWILCVCLLYTSANYELAQRFQAFSLGGKLNNNSLRLYPNEINDTDNFWFDFTTSTGKHYYYVNPKEAKKELLFDNTEMAMQLTELTHDVVNSARIDLNGIEFSKDQKTFTFRYNSKKYEYSRLTRKLKEVQEEKEEKEEGPIYSLSLIHISLRIQNQLKMGSGS